VLGFSFGTMFLQLNGVLALIGLMLLVRERTQLRRDERIRLWLLLFILIWIPMLLSLMDGQVLLRSQQTTLRYLIYVLGGVALIRGLRHEDSQGVVTGVMAVLLFWTSDALMQYVSGFNLLGFPYQRGERLTGLFYPWPDIGYFMAVLSPLMFEGVRLWGRRWGFAWLFLAPWLAVILLSGQRTAWMLLVFSITGYVLHLYLAGRIVLTKRLIAPVLIVAAIGGVVVGQESMVRERLMAVENVFSGDYQAANEASSIRLPLWEASLRIFQAHWVSGIGPRAYPEVMKRYVEQDSVWSEHPAGHPHLFVLEVAAETGLNGLLGYVFMQGLLLVLFLQFRG
jgi:O-antigen ligase